MVSLAQYSNLYAFTAIVLKVIIYSFITVILEIVFKATVERKVVDTSAN